MAPRILHVCLAIIRWAPVVFITAVIVWSYYAYVVQLCIFTVPSVLEKVLYLIFYHPILAVFLWTYHQTIFADVGSVPSQFYLSPSEAERFELEENEDRQKEMLNQAARNLPVQCRTAAGSVRYCERCKCIKPDRCHHCSVCGSCVLKMDHHCPWVNNCVNFRNYKFFVLFLAYALIYCLYVAATTFQYFIQFWSNIRGSHGLGNLHILFLFFAASMFALSVLFLFIYHLFLTSNNRSTLETFRAPIFRSGPDKNGFSLGKRGNFAEVFGDDRKLWFLPVFSSRGDGVTYTTNVPQPASYNSMDNTISSVVVDASVPPPAPVNETAPQPSFGDGVNFPVRSVDEDYDSLLGQRQRWMEDGEGDFQGDGHGYDNGTMVQTAQM